LNAAAACGDKVMRVDRAVVARSHITLSQDRRVAVSWHVPPALHQQIRNVLLSEV
jgi:hypothetical protein